MALTAPPILSPHPRPRTRLASALAPQLVELGDGLEEAERQTSGWNKILHKLLIALRERIRAGNTLHTDEQIVLFRGCARSDVDTANSALLSGRCPRR